MPLNRADAIAGRVQGHTAHRRVRRLDDAANVRGFTRAGCMAHARRSFDEARKGGDSTHANTALDFIGRLSLIERVLWDRDRPCTPAQPSAGLTVAAKLNSKTYRKGQEVADEEMELLSIRRHRMLPEWTYTIKPCNKNRLQKL